jgi:hypothetical protein
MKLTWLMLVCLAVMTAAGQTSQGWKICRNPVRVFSGQATVDLSPLFDWWAWQTWAVTSRNAATNRTAGALTNAFRSAPRPLPAWQRVTGFKTGTLGSSWLVDAVIYTSPTVSTNARIILNHPPVVEEATFDALTRRTAEIEQQIADATRAYQASTNAEAQAMARLQYFRHSWDKLAPDGVRDYSVLVSQRHNEAAAALDQLDQLEAARIQTQQQLKTIPAANGMYRVDWFAVLLGRTKQGLPIYDLGLVSPTPP